MGVYIKGMDMPKDCTECELIYNDHFGYPRCCISGLLSINGRTKRDCPLTEVPEPHGRLIDGDKAVKDYHNYGISHSYDAFDLEDIIAESPTVIERSK